jgi:eukaryotic-like serine/threonine-protein kinase
VSRALALEPTNASALRTFVSLLTTPPRDVPADARAEMVADALATHRSRLRAAAWASVAWSILSVLSLLNGVRSVALAAVFVGSWVAASVTCFAVERRPHPQAKPPLPLIAVLVVATATTSLAFGPFAVVPTVATFHLISFLANPDRTRRGLLAAAGLAAILLPLVLEWTGILAPSYRFVDGTLQILPRLFAFTGVGTVVTLVVANVVFLTFAFGLMARFRDVLTDAERRVYLQSWQLRQLAPAQVE